MSSIRLASRVSRIKPSPTLAVDARAKELKAQGKDVIGLGAGEPDFDTPDFIKDAAIKAIRHGLPRTGCRRDSSREKAIVAKFKRDNGLDFAPPSLVVLRKQVLQSGTGLLESGTSYHPCTIGCRTRIWCCWPMASQCDLRRTSKAQVTANAGCDYPQDQDVLSCSPSIHRWSYQERLTSSARCCASIHG